jgi:multiple sugar transport system permease protein
MIANIRGVRRERTREGAGGRSNLFGYVFIAPALILYLVFNVWTIFRGFAMAFTDYRFLLPKSRWDFNGLANFKEMISDPDVWQSLGVALRYTAMVLPTTLILAVLLAVVISKVRRGANFYRWMVYLPVILPVAVTFLMFGELYNFRFGFINSVLRNWGVKSPPDWLGDVSTVLPSIAAADVWRSLGFPTLLFLVGIYNINSELYEAAAIDGATGGQQFLRITLPLLKPVFALVLVLNIGVIGVTEPMLILTGGDPQNASRTIGLYVYQVALQLGDLRLGYAAAMSLVLGLASALISLIVFRVLREK